MKAKEISLTLVRNVGPYESARMGVVYDLSEQEDVSSCFKKAKKEIEDTFEEMFEGYKGDIPKDPDEIDFLKK